MSAPLETVDIIFDVQPDITAYELYLLIVWAEIHNRWPIATPSWIYKSKYEQLGTAKRHVRFVTYQNQSGENQC